MKRMHLLYCNRSSWARFKRRTFHVPNAVQTIVNELINESIMNLLFELHTAHEKFDV